MPFNQQSSNGNVRNTTGNETYLCFNTSPTGVPTLPATFSWNTVDGTMDLRLNTNTALQLGQEAHIYGKASGAIGNGKLCMFNGAEGDHIKIKQIGVGDIATMQAHQHYFVGVATDDIANGSYGYITWFGKVNGVYTKAVNTGDSAGDWAAGDILYFSNTTGQLTKTVPDAPGIMIEVAAVIKAATGSSENGVIMVRPTFGQRLANLEDVDGVALTTTGQMLVWDNTAAVWSATQTTTTSVRAAGTADDSHLPTEKAVRDAIGGSGYVPEAPSDSKYYARYNASWQELIIVT